jgi:hypothetical protein
MVFPTFLEMVRDGLPVLSMRTARPAAGPPHPIFEFGTHSFDMLPPCLLSLDGDGPAYPLVARERRDVFPGRQNLCFGGERLSEISRKVMYHSSGDSNGSHWVIPQVKDQPSDTRVQLEIQDDRGLVRGYFFLNTAEVGGGFWNGRYGSIHCGAFCCEKARGVLRVV